jgi:hypothetical protein
MFHACHNFDQPLDSWGLYLTNVTNMKGMFIFCENFNQPLDSWGPYLTNVTDMSFMFCKCINFNQPLDSWGEYLINITDMTKMFADSVTLNQSFVNWDINENTDISDMFLDTVSMQETNYPPRIQDELILTTDTAFNLISREDENVLDYLKQDTKNIVFKFKNIYHFITKKNNI